jgi:hypothetical protein
MKPRTQRQRTTPNASEQVCNGSLVCISLCWTCRENSREMRSGVIMNMRLTITNVYILVDGHQLCCILYILQCVFETTTFRSDRFCIRSLNRRFVVGDPRLNLGQYTRYVRFEVCTAVTMKNDVSWHITPTSYLKGDTLRLRYRVQPANAMYSQDLRFLQQWLWRMPSTGMLRRVAFVKSDVYILVSSADTRNKVLPPFSYQILSFRCK